MIGSERISWLSAGIFEALWTTVFGLIVGIVFMFMHYYYDYKLSRIQYTWEMFRVEFLSRFCPTGRIRIGVPASTPREGSAQKGVEH